MRVIDTVAIANDCLGKSVYYGKDYEQMLENARHQKVGILVDYSYRDTDFICTRFYIAHSTDEEHMEWVNVASLKEV